MTSENVLEPVAESSELLINEKSLPLDWEKSGRMSLLNTSATSDDTLTERRSSTGKNTTKIAHASMPDLSRVAGTPRSTSMSSVAGRHTPVRPLSLMEYQTKLSDLQKENFNLKLRIYFLESKLPKLQNLSGEDVLKVNLDLQVTIEEQKSDLERKEIVLERALQDFEKLGRSKAQEIQEITREHQYTVTTITERLTESQETIEKLRSELQTTQRHLHNMDEENHHLRANVEKLREQQQLHGSESDSDISLLGEKERVILDLKTTIANKDVQMGSYQEKLEWYQQLIDELKDDMKRQGAEVSLSDSPEKTPRAAPRLTEQTGIEEGSLFLMPGTEDHIKTLENEIKEKDALVENMKARILELENCERDFAILRSTNSSNKDQQQTTIAQLRKEIERITHELESFKTASKATLSAKQREIDALTAELSAISAQNRKMNEKTSANEPRRNDSERENSNLHSKSSLKERELADLSSRSPAQQREMQRDSTNLSPRWDSPSGSIDRKLWDTSDRLGNSTDVTKMRQEMTRMEMEIARLKALVDAVQNPEAAELSEVVKLKDKKNSDLNSLLESSANKDKEIAMLKSQLLTLENEHVNEEVLKSKEEEILALRDQLNSLKLPDVSALRTALAEKDEQMESLRAQIESLNSAVERFRKELRHREIENETMKAQMNKAMSDNSLSRKVDISEYEAKIASLDALTRSLSDKLTCREAQIKQISAEMAGLKNASVTTASGGKSPRDLIRQKEAEIANLRRQLGETAEEAEARKQELDSRKTDVRNLQKDLERLRAEFDAKQSQFFDREQELERKLAASISPQKEPNSGRIKPPTDVGSTARSLIPVKTSSIPDVVGTEPRISARSSAEEELRKSREENDMLKQKLIEAESWKITVESRRDSRTMKGPNGVNTSLVMSQTLIELMGGNDQLFNRTLNTSQDLTSLRSTLFTLKSVCLRLYEKLRGSSAFLKELLAKLGGEELAKQFADVSSLNFDLERSISATNKAIEECSDVERNLVDLVSELVETSKRLSIAPAQSTPAEFTPADNQSLSLVTTDHQKSINVNDAGQALKDRCEQLERAVADLQTRNLSLQAQLKSAEAQLIQTENDNRAARKQLEAEFGKCCTDYETKIAAYQEDLSKMQVYGKQLKQKLANVSAEAQTQREQLMARLATAELAVQQTAQRPHCTSVSVGTTFVATHNSYASTELTCAHLDTLCRENERLDADRTLLIEKTKQYKTRLHAHEEKLAQRQHATTITQLTSQDIELMRPHVNSKDNCSATELSMKELGRMRPPVKHRDQCESTELSMQHMEQLRWRVEALSEEAESAQKAAKDWKEKAERAARRPETSNAACSTYVTMEQVDKLTRRVDSLARELHATRSEHNAAEARTEEATRTVESLSKENEACRTRLDAMRHSINTVVKERDVLKEQLSSLQSHPTAQTAHHSTNTVETMDDLNDLERKCVQLEAEMRSKNADLETIIQQLNSNNSELEKRVKENTLNTDDAKDGIVKELSKIRQVLQQTRHDIVNQGQRSARVKAPKK